MKKLIILLVSVMIIAAGCTPSTDSANDMETAGTVAKEAAIVAEGELTEGQRVISLESGFSGQEIIVYRGNTVQFEFSGEGHVSISLPEFEEEAEGENSAIIDVKAKEVGEYIIDTYIGDISESGKFIVVEYKQEGSYYKVNAQEFEAQMNGNYVLLDVRTQGEYDSGAINDATLIPLNELSSRVSEISEFDKVLVYCRSGNRSVAASEILLESGFSEVYDLQGGIGAWQAYKNE